MENKISELKWQVRYILERIIPSNERTLGSPIVTEKAKSASLSEIESIRVGVENLLMLCNIPPDYVQAFQAAEERDVKNQALH